MRPDYIDLQLDLAQLRDRPMPATTRALELERAILRVERARREVRAAVTKSDEELAQFHLKLAAGHLAKVTALHPGVKTWKPKKKRKPKKVQGLTPPTHEDQKVFMRSEYRGRGERRFVSDFRPGQEIRGHSAHRRLEVRDIKGGSGTLVNVEGEPIQYRSPYTVVDRFGEFQETMLPGVASHLLASADCRFLINHTGLPLARSSAGNLKLSDTPTSLRFTATVDTRSRQANDLIVAIERADVTSMSVGFVVAEGGDRWSSDYTQREVSRFRSLEDVSAVTYPASPSTTISLAGMGGRV